MVLNPFRTKGTSSETQTQEADKTQYGAYKQYSKNTFDVHGRFLLQLNQMIIAIVKRTHEYNTVP